MPTLAAQNAAKMGHPAEVRSGVLGRIGRSMRVTAVLDDELVEKAMSYSGLRQRFVLIREVINALIEREAARRLAGLGGSEPDLVAVPRRRSAAK
jgi:Bacterial antitoxin of type II TA system, VapB